MSETPKQEPYVSASKKAILADLGADTDLVTTLRTNAEADEYISYLKSKAVPPTEPKKEKMLKINTQLGHEPDSLPPADQILPKVLRMNVAEAMNPLCPKKGVNNRRNEGSRIQMIFTPEYPDGRLFWWL